MPGPGRMGGPGGPGGPGGNRGGMGGPGGPGMRGPGGMGGHGGPGMGSHRNPPPPPNGGGMNRGWFGGWNFGRRIGYNRGCGCCGCAMPVMIIAAAIIGVLVVLLF